MDVQAYLQRIGHVAPNVSSPNIETLRALHRAHLFTVPFENLDISRRREIVCDQALIVNKIVKEHRGGFCYELNGAFAALLRALGFTVTLLSARVAREGGGFSQPFDHLTLLVDLEEPRLADVGFGDCFVEPLRLETGDVQRQNSGDYRISKSDDTEFVLEAKRDGKWKPEYAFTLHPHALSEFSAMCHYHQTSPESHFTQQRICTLATPEGRITLSDKKLIETRGGVRTETPLSGNAEWRVKLREYFGIALPD